LNAFHESRVNPRHGVEEKETDTKKRKHQCGERIIGYQGETGRPIVELTVSVCLVDERDTLSNELGVKTGIRSARRKTRRRGGNYSVTRADINTESGDSTLFSSCGEDARNLTPIRGKGVIIHSEKVKLD